MIVSIGNQKGGVGKTTSAHALGDGLAKKGYRVLFVDLDPQWNLTHCMKANPRGITAIDVLTKKATALDAIQRTDQGVILPAYTTLSAADTAITNTGKEYRLKEALEPIKALFDFIIIDCPPALGTLTVNALTASDTLIVPAQADIFSFQGVAQLAETVAEVKKYCNPGLDLAGILLTRHSGRAVLSRDMAAMMRKMAAQMGTVVFDSVIREGIAIKEAQTMQLSIFDYAPRSKAAADSAAFVAEFLERVKKK